MDPVKLEALSKLLAALASLAWPLVALAVVVVYRTALRDLVGRLRQFDGPGGVKFTADAQRIATVALARADRVHALGMRRYVEEMSSLVEQLGRPPRVLWVDDQPSNNHYERAALEALGMWIQLSTNTDEGLEHARSGSFDIIISDMHRPGDERAGFTLLSRLTDAHIGAPYIIYSAKFANSRRGFDAAVKAGGLGCANMAEGLVRLVLRALRGNLEKARLETQQTKLEVTAGSDAVRQPKRWPARGWCSRLLSR